MSNEIDGYADFYFATVRTARKAHKCSACRLAIHPRERYCEIRMGYEGTASTLKRCGRCESIYQHLGQKCAEARGQFLAPEELLDCGLDYEEEWGEPPPVEIQALVFATNAEASALLPPAARAGGGRE